VLRSENKNGGLDQYGAGPFEQLQFGTAGIEGVNYTDHDLHDICLYLRFGCSLIT